MISPISWQQELANAITEPAELLALLDLPQDLLPAALAADHAFRLKVPRAFVAKMAKGQLNDPLLQQILPVGKELVPRLGFSDDPLIESQANPLPGLLHKYQNRALLIVTGACAVNCRYCFRRHFPYADNKPSQRQWAKALQYLAEQPSISEVILSGGDPLLAPDHVLAPLVEGIAGVPHIRSLRVHTRLPVMVPSRITPELINWLTGTRLKPVLVTHINHPNEIDEPLSAAMRTLQSHGVTLLNQSVLLKGINDNVATLTALSERLFWQAGILPYYLHLLDKVNGAAHFEVNVTTAIPLMRQLRAELSGYLVPRLAQEVAGERSKTVIA